MSDNKHLKVGDRVRVCSKCPHEDSSCSFATDMEKYRGMIGIIVSYTESQHYTRGTLGLDITRTEGYQFFEDEVELLPSEDEQNQDIEDYYRELIDI